MSVCLFVCLFMKTTTTIFMFSKRNLNVFLVGVISNMSIKLHQSQLKKLPQKVLKPNERRLLVIYPGTKSYLQNNTNKDV